MSEGKHSENEDGSWTERCLKASTVRMKMARLAARVTRIGSAPTKRRLGWLDRYQTPWS